MIVLRIYNLATSPATIPFYYSACFFREKIKEEDYSSSPNDPMYANVPINITNTGPVTSISPIALNMNIDSIPNTIHIRA